MSVLQNPLIGRAKQKLGGSVFSTWKGINVLKGKPLSVANPKTDKQLMRRSALSQIVAIGRQIKAAIDNGFNEQAVRKSAFNAFSGYNLRNAFIYSTPPAATFEATGMLIAQGTIAPTPMTTLTCDVSSAKTVIDWTPGTLQPGQSNSDVAIVVVLNLTQNLQYGITTAIARTVGTVEVAIADLPFDAGDNMFAYLAFFNATSRKASDSRYLATTAIP